MEQRTHPYGRATLAIGAVFLVNGMTFSSWFARLPELRERLDVSDGALGLTLVGGGIGGLAVSIVSGAVVDRVGSRAATVATSLGLSTLLPLVGLASAAPLLFATLILLGALDGMTDVAMNAQAVQLHRDSGRSTMSRFHALWSAGAVIGGLIGSRAAAADVSLRLQLAMTAAVLVVITLGAARCLLPPAPRSQGAEHGLPARAPGHRPLLVRLFAVGAAVALTEMPPNDWSTLLMTDRFDVSDGTAGLGFVAVAAGMLVGRLLGDAVIARVGLERARRAGGLLALAGTVIATSVPTVIATSCGFFVAGLGIAVLFPVMFRTSGELIGGSTTGMAAFSSGARFGFLVAPPLVGLIAELTSIATAVLLVSGVAAVAVAASSLPTTADRPTVRPASPVSGQRCDTP